MVVDRHFADRRTGIDAWPREMESIRDELIVAFLVISELNRQEGGSYDTTPHMGLIGLYRLDLPFGGFTEMDEV